MNLGRSQRDDLEESTETIDSSVENETDDDSPTMSEYFKQPLPDECEEAIALQADLIANNYASEWNLRDFYRDVQVIFEQDTNSKSVFERCIQLAR